MPIIGLTGAKQQLPLAGRIKLGSKDEKTGRPLRVDYFLVPEEVQRALGLKDGKPYGAQPKELEVLLPADDLDTIFPHYLRKYEPAAGVVCRGDGQTAKIWDAEHKAWQKTQCGYKECPHYQKGLCKPYGRLHVVLPATRSTECYAVDVSSVQSIKALLADLAHIKEIAGKLKGIPLELYREPRKTSIGANRYTFHILRLRYAGDFEVALKQLISPAEEAPEAPAEPEQVADLAELLASQGYKGPELARLLELRFGVSKLDELAEPQVEDLLAWLAQQQEDDPERLAAYIAKAFPQPA